MKYKIEHDVDACIGCGACAAICPKYWVMEGLKSKLLKEDCPEEDFECNKEAANVCPVDAIKIYDENGKKVVG